MAPCGCRYYLDNSDSDADAGSRHLLEALDGTAEGGRRDGTTGVSSGGRAGLGTAFSSASGKARRFTLGRTARGGRSRADVSSGAVTQAASSLAQEVLADGQTGGLTEAVTGGGRTLAGSSANRNSQEPDEENEGDDNGEDHTSSEAGAEAGSKPGAGPGKVRMGGANAIKDAAGRPVCLPASGHGGSGMILSIGLLRKISQQDMEE